MLLSYITKSTSRTEVAYGSTRCMLKNIVSNAYKCIFLAEHLAILTDECKTVNIWVNNDTEVIAALCKLIHNACEILLKWLWIMCEVTVRLAIQELILNTELIKELWKDDTTNRIDRINNNTETCLLDCLKICKLKVENSLYMTVVKVLFCIFTHVVNISILKCLCLSNSKNLIAVILCKELTTSIKELEGIPMTRVMRSCDDDTTVSTCHSNGKLCGRSRSKADIDNIIAHAHQRTTNHVLHHLARDTSITTNNNLVCRILSTLTDECSVSRCKLYDIKRIKGITSRTADSTTNTRN